ncbi:Ppx/GppA family phosphatase [Sphingomonas prati]|uniref:Exopolyphosphatase/guanosine-5'-triphosphate, 3'-diphosphate pyrophosphatase n=1 Tax=Sphingomonas prati TaxID=1843237 RepID=A0A7W9BR22_9SPHN|nr:Ppx/GppA family phosphatase [Sphingomonas prati]MBB5728563.1 exopolyphosphatase/guanosine-5'-triphosphate,3'-diphosphate pyrophosphatase [Sphingomonas prati]GGE72797.1 exopolyphosphatase [Sphingomonas prati]
MALPIFRRRDEAAPSGRIGIIDIGSNSIRLVVYDAPTRTPVILFNEKVMAGLGKGLAKDGALAQDGIARGMTALKRFATLARQMEVSSLRTVATAAVRDARNGALFLEQIKALGLQVELLSGDQEATMAGMGVLAGIPGADGIVGDLGGGSLELIRVHSGTVHEKLSLPLGVLRLAAIRARGPGALQRTVAAGLDAAGWTDIPAGLPLYLVGGSWRALARLDMYLEDWPLPIIHHYRMPSDRAARLVRVLAQIDRKRLREVIGLSASRLPTLPDAAALLSVVVRQLQTSSLVASAYGLREGLLHDTLPVAERRQDPLITATREEGGRQGRFAEHGDLLHNWIAPLFPDEGAEDARLRHAACLLGDVGWRAHPEFRAARGLDTALHGNWVGIDARGRAIVARALYTSFGGTLPVPLLDRLFTAEDKAMADRWGHAMRLGQRLSGGVAGPLAGSSVALAGDAITLTLPADHRDLAGESVERRLKILATALGRRPETIVG